MGVRCSEMWILVELWKVAREQAQGADHRASGDQRESRYCSGVGASTGHLAGEDPGVQSHSG